MRIRRLAALAAVSLALPLARASDAPLDHGVREAPADGHDHISPEERASIWREIETHQKRLAFAKAGERPAFIWPVRVARGPIVQGGDRVGNFVDHDATFPGSRRDYSCGQRTYDTESGYNHRGTDITSWPDGWNMMAARQLEIVAAAPGTIVNKADGHFDQNCAFNSNPWNAVYVQHDDGSVAWYGHMKAGTVTSKPIGARVVAGELLGNVGSSGSSTAPHLHFEVYDANKQLVDPFAGSCNERNTESWWAHQPDYAKVRVNRVIAATALPVSPTCSEGKLAAPGTLNEKSDFAPGEVAYFVAFVREMPQGATTVITIRRPDGSAWRTYTSPPAQSFFVGALTFASYALPANEPAGTWTVEATVGESTTSAPFTLTADGAGIPNYTDLWWNPAESGWGINVNHQGGAFFATWFTYDADGAGMWLVMPEGTGTATRKTGTLYRATGIPFASINGAAAAHFPLPAVGTGTFDVIDASTLRFTYSVNGISQAKLLQRQAFAAPTHCVETRTGRTHATNYQDLWWNPSEPGWGLNIAHQGDTLFATWFTYGAGGRGQWLVGSDLRRQATGEYHGRLYRTTGRAFDQVSAAAAVVASMADVGEATLTFLDGERGRFDYTVDGVTQSKTISRLQFGATAPLCRS
jgi:murein DD-endopeptidase MepM/ murein hydrolase activator NlpD